MTRAEYRQARRNMRWWELRLWNDGCIRITSPQGDWELTEYGLFQLHGLIVCASIVLVLLVGMLV